MTEKYFYTDPLAAAWMAKHFGMKLLSGTDLHGLVDAGARFIDCDDTFRELWQHDFSYLGNLYIHPDSLPLLESRLGDVLYTRINSGAVSVEEFLSDERASQTGPYLISRGGRIIQRNGIPFFWPEKSIPPSTGE